MQNIRVQHPELICCVYRFIFSEHTHSQQWLQLIHHSEFKWKKKKKKVKIHTHTYVEWCQRNRILPYWAESRLNKCTYNQLCVIAMTLYCYLGETIHTDQWCSSNRNKSGREKKERIVLFQAKMTTLTRCWSHVFQCGRRWKKLRIWFGRWATVCVCACVCEFLLWSIDFTYVTGFFDG